jgi:hypothetical protein
MLDLSILRIRLLTKHSLFLNVFFDEVYLGKIG